MRKAALHILALLMLFSLLLPLPARAANAVDVSRECSLELHYSANGTAFSGLQIRIYRVAEIDPDGDYALVDPFHRLPVKIHGITSQKEWRDAASTLAAYITAEQIPATKTEKTDASGKAAFAGLDTGIYLVLGAAAETEENTYRFENFCIFLPTPDGQGGQDYAVTAKPKSTVTPNPEKPEPVSYRVTKLWKDAGNRNKRPRSVTVDILKNGIVQETVLLDAGNNWTYGWTAPEDGAEWSVVEKNVPDAYTVVITSSGSTFTITNTHPVPEGNPPRTGDTFALGPWLAVMSVSGILLILCGSFAKRKRR